MADKPDVTMEKILELAITEAVKTCFAGHTAELYVTTFLPALKRRLLPLLELAEDIAEHTIDAKEEWDAAKKEALK